jgi:hypothetical protein
MYIEKSFKKTEFYRLNSSLAVKSILVFRSWCLTVKTKLVTFVLNNRAQLFKFHFKTYLDGENQVSDICFEQPGPGFQVPLQNIPWRLTMKQIKIEAEY